MQRSSSPLRWTAARVGARLRRSKAPPWTAPGSNLSPPGSSLGFSALPEDEDSPVPPPGHRSGSGRQVHVVPAEDPSPSLSSLPEAAGRVGRDSSAASGPPAETQSAR